MDALKGVAGDAASLVTATRARKVLKVLGFRKIRSLSGGSLIEGIDQCS